MNKVVYVCLNETISVVIKICLKFVECENVCELLKIAVKIQNIVVCTLQVYRRTGTQNYSYEYY